MQKGGHTSRLLYGRARPWHADGLMTKRGRYAIHSIARSCHCRSMYSTRVLRSSGQAALSQTRHLIRLHCRNTPCLRVPSRQNQCRRDREPGVWGRGTMTCPETGTARAAGAGGKQRRTSRRLIWCATSYLGTQTTEKRDFGGVWCDWMVGKTGELWKAGLRQGVVQPECRIEQDGEREKLVATRRTRDVRG